MTKQYYIEYSLDNATVEDAYFSAEDEFDAEEQLEIFLSTDKYDLITIEEVV
jgi:hypothetical protein